MTTISAKCVAKSKHPEANITVATVIATYPRWIHAEARTHRLISICEGADFLLPRTPSPMEDPNLSRNAASSRAIPVAKMIEAVMSDPAVPLFWGKNIAGMQAAEELPPRLIEKARNAWLMARDRAVDHAQQLMELERDDGMWIGCHKQIVNRLLEPFSHITVVFTATDWLNFFKLRIHRAAEPHICLLAERIKEAIDATPARVLDYDEWHTPFVKAADLGTAWSNSDRIFTSVAACARTSYNNHDGTAPNLAADKALHDRLLQRDLTSTDPMHASPAEHQCKPDHFYEDDGGRHWDKPELHGNLHGFIQYRKTLRGEAVHG